ncbi:MAG: hypothetical protein AAFW76_05305, partial [Pseudomonadota bacterium]
MRRLSPLDDETGLTGVTHDRRNERMDWFDGDGNRPSFGMGGASSQEDGCGQGCLNSIHGGVLICNV